MLEVNFGPSELLSVIHPRDATLSNQPHNPIYTLDHVAISWVPIPHLKGSSRGGFLELGALHPKGPPTFFPMILRGSPRFPVNCFSIEAC